MRYDDGAIDVTDLPESVPETTATTSTPDGSGEDVEIADVPDSMPDTSATPGGNVECIQRSKRKRNDFPCQE